MHNYISASLVSASLFMTACGSSDDKPDAETPSYEGLWQAPAYGQAMDYHNDVVSLYEYTSDYCLLAQQMDVTEEELQEEGWALSDSGSELREIITIGGTHSRNAVFSRADELPLSCQKSLLAKVGDKGYQADPEQDFDLFWQTFQEYYLSFDRKDVDWNAQYEEFRYEITPDSTDEELFDVLAAMVEPLKDAHVEIASEDDDVSFSNHLTTIERLTTEFTNVNGEVDTEEQYEAYVDYVVSQIELMDDIRLSYAVDEGVIKSAANEEVIWYLAPDNIGVLVIDSMAGFSAGTEEEIDAADELAVLEDAIIQALTDLQDTDGLIIDVRDNTGGFDAASQLIARHFLDTERHLYSKQARLGSERTELEPYYLTPAEQNVYLKDVVLLTSRNTASAAEVFTLMMRNLPNVTVIGEPTQGALSDMLEKTLPNGFSFSLSNEFYQSPEGEWFEHTGIPVDEDVPYGTLDQRQNEEDLGLETAHAMLTN